MQVYKKIDQPFHGKLPSCQMWLSRVTLINLAGVVNNSKFGGKLKLFLKEISIFLTSNP